MIKPQDCITALLLILFFLFLMLSIIVFHACGYDAPVYILQVPPLLVC